MNKRLKKIATMSLIGIVGLTQTGCMGSFKLLTGVYSWNETVTQNKAINNIIFWAFCVIPVYEVAAFVDLVILNFLEFWTGSNPVAMGPDDTEEQSITKDGITYTLRATQNKFELLKPNEEVAMSMIYTVDNATWNLETKDGLQPLAQNLEGNKVKIFHANGKTQIFENNMDNLAILGSSINSKFSLANN